MALSTVELSIHRKGTEQFIAADKTTVILKSRGEAYYDAGTQKFGLPVERPPQDFKIIWAGDNGIVREVGESGEVRRFDFILVGKHDAQVAIGDYWKSEDSPNQENRIEYRFPDNGYEVKVGGVSHGPKPTGA
jgi:hypothetical protein